MPCDASYMEPNEHEKESKRAAKLILYLGKRLTLTRVGYLAFGTFDSVELHRIADEYYGAPTEIDALVRMLCGMVGAISDEEMRLWVYDGSIPIARDLAAWWERHCEADEKRKAVKCIEQGERKVRVRKRKKT